jgi:hypothetical protein
MLTTTVTAQTVWQKIAPLQTAAVALVTGAAPLVMVNGFAWPSTVAAWAQFFIMAAIGGGLLHITAPRNQGALVVPPTNVSVTDAKPSSAGTLNSPSSGL